MPIAFDVPTQTQIYEVTGIVAGPKVVAARPKPIGLDPASPHVPEIDNITIIVHALDEFEQAATDCDA